MPRVSIIILNFNTKALLQQCLQSIFATTKGLSVEVIVVDNASSDDSVSMIKKEFKQVLLIENKENSGFAKGNAIGAAKAKGEILFFLNSDTLLESSLEKSLTLFDDEHVGVVGGKMENPDGSWQRSHGKFYTLIRAAAMLVGGDRAEGSPTQSTETVATDWVSGGCMMIRKDVFEKLHGFDNYFFMYIEDMELCFRVKKQGYQVLFSPDLAVAHVGQGSSNRAFAIGHIYKGILYFFKKHRYYGEYIVIRILLFLKAAFLIFLGAITNNKYLLQTYTRAIRYTL